MYGWDTYIERDLFISHLKESDRFYRSNASGPAPTYPTSFYFIYILYKIVIIPWEKIIGLLMYVQYIHVHILGEDMKI